MRELNPNHPMTRDAHHHWYKIAALLVQKLGVRRVVITADEIEMLDGQAITIRCDDNIGIELRLVSMAEGEVLARKEGGLPV